jgi:hypothetical protein
MRISQAFLVLTLLGSLCDAGAAQSTAGGPPAPSQSEVAHEPSTSSAGVIPPAPDAPPSGILQPSLDKVQQTVGALKLDKWKRGTVREEANANISDIQRDVQTTLPSLLKDADAAPGALSQVLPLSRNVDALYDVLLRVEEGARVSAPAEQVTALQQALVTLQKARSALDLQLQETAAAQEKQVTVLRTTLQAQAAARAAVTPAPVPTCPAPPPAKKAVRKRKPPATTPQTPPAATATPPKTGH